MSEQDWETQAEGMGKLGAAGRACMSVNKQGLRLCQVGMSPARAMILEVPRCV